MKHLKTLALLAVAAAALTAFAGSASAFITSPAGTTYGGQIVATSTNSQLHGTVGIACTHSELRGAPTSAGNTTVSVSYLTFTGCSRSVTVTGNGHIYIYSNGEIKSNGTRITVQTTILGFPVHCIYTAQFTKIGTLTEGVAPAKLHIGSSPIPQEATSGACGDDAVWTGTYTVTNPTQAIVVFT